MKERPIVCYAHEVRSILDDRQTQLRRVVKLPPCEFSYAYYGMHEGEYMFGEKELPEEGTWPVPCPYGQPGDRLWVRETWMPHTEDGTPSGATIFKATDMPEPDGDRPLRWRPSIHLSRRNSRITLEVTGVRVERVQDISEVDAAAEGARPCVWYCPSRDESTHVNLSTVEGSFGCANYINGFANLWDSINKKRGFCWLTNPWVWVVEFRRGE